MQLGTTEERRIPDTRYALGDRDRRKRGTAGERRRKNRRHSCGIAHIKSGKLCATGKSRSSDIRHFISERNRRKSDTSVKRGITDALHVISERYIRQFVTSVECVRRQDIVAVSARDRHGHRRDVRGEIACIIRTPVENVAEFILRSSIPADKRQRDRNKIVTSDENPSFYGRHAIGHRYFRKCAT